MLSVVIVKMTIRASLRRVKPVFSNLAGARQFQFSKYAEAELTTVFVAVAASAW